MQLRREVAAQPREARRRAAARGRARRAPRARHREAGELLLRGAVLERELVRAEVLAEREEDLVRVRVRVKG